MSDSDAIRVSPALSVPRTELVMKATRSGGAGGQHVNTSSSRIELVWDVAASPSVDEHQRALLLKHLATRLDSLGKLRLVSQDERSQFQNREAALERFAELIARALVIPKKRKPTRVPKSAKRARLDLKKKRGAIKRDRRRPMAE